MSDDADAPEGYGKPPIANQIKSNEVRNPWGRKGKPRLKVDFLDGPFELKMDGKSVKVTRDDAIDFALFKQAVAGNVSAAKELTRRRRERALAAKTVPAAEDLASEDQRAFARYLEREAQGSETDRESGTDTLSSPLPATGGKRP